MNKFLAQFGNDLRSNLKWVHAWIIGINLYVLLAVGIYPGEDALQGFLGLLDEEYFQAFLGQIDVENPAYSIWLALMIPFLSIAIAIFALLFGVRLAALAVTDQTGELIHTQPLDRSSFLIVRFLVGIVFTVETFLVSSILFRINLVGEYLEPDVIFQIGWWGILFTLALVTVGMIVGTLAADTGRGTMIALMIGVLMYAIQIIGRILPQAEDINEYNPLTWYLPETVILGETIPDTKVLYIVVMLIVGLTLAIISFSKRDLILEAGLTIPLVSKFVRTRASEEVKNGNNLHPRSYKTDRDSIFVRWIRPLERRLPFTADFIYSERRVILVMFWLLILFYPLQLMAFDPNDPEFVRGLEQTIASFGSSGIFRVFTYGHEITDLWLWLLITQAIGNHWFFFVPLTAHWIKKILLADTENETAEIYGSLPISHKKVLLQRMIAVFFELLFFVIQTIFWLILSEIVRDVSYNTTWEVIALLGVIPLYIFLVTTGVLIGLLVDRGVTYARLGLIVIVFLFITNVMLEDVAIPDLIGLYDPVLLITEQTLAASNYGVLWLTGAAIISSTLVYYLAGRFKWMYIPNDKDSLLVPT